MAFVKRNLAGEIVAISAERLPDLGEGAVAPWEEVRGDEPEVLAFSHALTHDVNPVGVSDIAFVRVLEDLIDLLIDRSIIRFTDLPAAAQEKLSHRRGTRAALQSLRLLDRDQSDVI